MQRKLKRLILCCALLLACSGYAGARLQEPDSAFSETGIAYDSLSEYDEEASDTAYAEDAYEEDLPPREIVYNKQTPTEARWLEASSDDAYTYRTKLEYVQRPQPPPKPDPAWLRWLMAFFAFFATTAGKIVLWSLLVLLVGFIIYRIIVGSGGGLFGRRDVKAGADTDAEQSALSEEGLMELNWAARMREALSAGNQREAIRFGYLHLLQQLHAQELIRFRQDKTNIAYYRELNETLRPGFREITRTYEFAWYGGYLPDAAGIETYLSKLEQFLQSLPKL